MLVSLHVVLFANFCGLAGKCHPSPGFNIESCIGKGRSREGGGLAGKCHPSPELLWELHCQGQIQGGLAGKCHPSPRLNFENCIIKGRSRGVVERVTSDPPF